MKGRATTDAEKRAVIERIYTAWCKLPTLRLGQFVGGCNKYQRSVLFDVEDEELAGRLERQADLLGVL